jgi:hypothetical protein
MSNPESFLTRWSRRKHAANAATEETTPSAAPSAAACRQGLEIEREPPVESECRDDTPDLPCPTPNAIDPPFDPLSLPRIESIGADTDIRGFLEPRVPPELTRAALRRAWAADPKIRDFVGPADYDWDFNAPGAMAGFGPLEMTDELRQMAAQIIGQIPSQDQADTTAGQTSGEPDQSDQAHQADQSNFMTPAGPVACEGHKIGPAENAPMAEPPLPSRADFAPQEELIRSNFAQDSPKAHN